MQSLRAIFRYRIDAATVQERLFEPTGEFRSCAGKAAKILEKMHGDSWGLFLVITMHSVD